MCIVNWMQIYGTSYCGALFFIATDYKFIFKDISSQLIII